MMKLTQFLLIPLIMCMIQAHGALPEQVHYEGRVLSVQEYRFIDRPASHLQFLMKTTEGEQITVEVGPLWYLDLEGLKIEPQEEIMVTGRMVRVDGTELLIASRVFKGNERWILRHPDGTPQWIKMGN